MPRITMREAISQALWEEMERDENVFIMGEEVGVWGGTYAVTKGFYDHFGAKRVRDTPIAEAAIVGIENSELTRCNHCKLADHRLEAKRQGRTLIRRRDPFGSWSKGSRYYSVLKGDPPTEDTFVAWMAEIPDQCCC